MRVLVLGGDGYLGWPTALYLSARGHDVMAVDNLVRRSYDTELGTASLVPITDLERRTTVWSELTGRSVTYVSAISPTTRSSRRHSERSGPTPSSTSGNSARLRTR